MIVWRPTAAWLCVSVLALQSITSPPRQRDVSIVIDSRMAPPRWATLERQLLADNVPACREFLHGNISTTAATCSASCAGAPTTARTMRSRTSTTGRSCTRSAPATRSCRCSSKGHEGLIKQYTEARTTDVPIARQGMYYKEFIVQSDWMHHGEGLQLFNRMGLSIPDRSEVPGARAALRRVLHGRGSRGAELRPGAQDHPQHGERQPRADAAEGDRRSTGSAIRSTSTDSTPCTANRRSSSSWRTTQEYGDVVGDHFLNLVATTLPMNAYLLAGEPKYKKWIVEYMDAWLDRMKQNDGIIPSFVDLDGRIGGPEGTVVEERLWLGLQPGQSGDRPPRRSQSHPAGAGRLQQRAARHRRSEVRRCLAHDDRRGQRARARTSTAASNIRRCTARTAGTAGATRPGTSARWRSGTGRRSRRIWRASGR